jgi:membrane protease YdiL (CAAX protease family)
MTSLEAADLNAADRKGYFLEVIVFLFLIAPSMVLSFFALNQGATSFGLVAIATILRDLALVSLITFFLWRNREPMVRIGWTPRAAPKEALLGALCFIPLLIVASLVDMGLRMAGFTGTPKSLSGFLTPAGRWEFLLAFLLVAVVAVAEETIFRGYLILRFEALTGSPITAALLSAVVFSVGHGYEGTAGVATVGVMGLGLAAVYLWRRSLVAPIVMHFLQDFTAIILVPLLTHTH